MFDSNHVFLGIAPIGWCNDDMPELGGENTFQQTVSEMATGGLQPAARSATSIPRILPS